MSRTPTFKVFKRTRPFQTLSFVRMIPNLATVMAMCMGLTAIRFAFLHKFELATTAICIAAILDALDGRLARLLGAASEFGAELDSLSDFLSFGVAPSLVMYFFSLHQWDNMGWTLCLFFTVCMGCRLARFNISSRNPEKPYWSYKFFTGVPAPAAAMIGLFPLIFFHASAQSWSQEPWFIAPFMVLVGLLMISSVPTFSFKSASISPKLGFPILIIMGLTVTFLFSAPWETLTAFVLFYILLIPISYIYFCLKYKPKIRIIKKQLSESN